MKRLDWLKLGPIPKNKTRGVKCVFLKCGISENYPYIMSLSMTRDVILCSSLTFKLDLGRVIHGDVALDLFTMDD